MSFLNPGAAAIAAALTIPPLIALYFLKLKRVVRPVPSTLLWKRAVEDLQVNSPFQRLRSSLLLLLQLLILVLAAVALGKPMFQAIQSHEGTVIILIDQSASMNVVEADGRTRLDHAKEQARRCVENMDDKARAMVIAFADSANVVSSFNTDKRALQRKIDSIPPTDGTSSLTEAVRLAEAYTQNIIIGSEEAGSDRPPESAAPLPAVFLFSDGRIEKTDAVALQRIDVDKIHMTTVGRRSDNVALTAMDARRNYERPEVLEVAATVQNFSAEPVTVDAVLYVDGQNVDVQSVRLEPARRATTTDDRSSATAPNATKRDASTTSEPNAADRETTAKPEADTVTTATSDRAGDRADRRERRKAGPADTTEPAQGSVRVIAFDEIEFGGGGIVRVALSVDDALSADNQAWTVIEPPHHLRVLLVTEGNPFLEQVLATLPLSLVKMTGAEYEAADDKTLLDQERSAFDVVVLDQHTTARLPQGNYFFWGSVPHIDGVSAGDPIDDQVIFNWDDTHPILRHVGVETLYVLEWLDLKLPPEAVSLIDGETSPVLAYLTRDASQFLICAFGLIKHDPVRGPLKNTYWMATADFVVFVQNAVQYLASNVAMTGAKSISPGEAVTLLVPESTTQVTVTGPDGSTDRVATGGSSRVHYARTRRVGPYHTEPALPGYEDFAVNLFNRTESDVRPVPQLTLGGATVTAQAGSVKVNQPAWPYLLLALLVFLILEWIVYNRRVYV